MTFYEAALRVLEREGKPLHVNAITEAALKENLLSHVGKSPEEVMQSRLLAMARRRTERKVVATAPLTYGLVEWNVPEDPAALAVAPELPPENEPPLRARERHPIPSPDKVRVSGRGERTRKPRRDEEAEGRRRRRFPPLPEVAFEVLTHSGIPMSAVDLAAAARERDLVSEDLGAEALLHALREDNRRRSDAGRKPAFSIAPTGDISLERAAPGEAPSVELEAAFAYALGMPLTEAKAERGPGAARLIAQAAEHRRQILRLVRRRLGDLDAVGFERAALALLEQQGFREVKVARRGKDGPLVMGRKKDGLSELRFVIQILRGGAELERDDVEDLRKDLLHYGAQLGLLVSPADITRDARHDAQASGQAPIILWCADAAAEKFAESKLGVGLVSVEVLDLDDDFFRRCREKPRDEERPRRGREERGGRGQSVRSPTEPAGPGEVGARAPKRRGAGAARGPRAHRGRGAAGQDAQRAVGVRRERVGPAG
jgi:HJR/Mrr/RecB family endonuclease